MSSRVEALRIAQVLAAELVVAARRATTPSDATLAQRAVTAALELVEAIGFDDRRATDAVTRLLTLATVLRLAATIDEASADTVVKRAILVYDQLSPGAAGIVTELVASHRATPSVGLPPTSYSPLNERPTDCGPGYVDDEDL